MHYIFHSEFRIIFHPTIIHSLFTLGHPNLRLFISHGGLLGTQEAIYHSVPLLGLPVVNDQLRNMVKLVKEVLFGGGDDDIFDWAFLTLVMVSLLIFR